MSNCHTLSVCLKTLVYIFDLNLGGLVIIKYLSHKSYFTRSFGFFIVNLKSVIIGSRDNIISKRSYIIV